MSREQSLGQPNTTLGYSSTFTEPKEAKTGGVSDGGIPLARPFTYNLGDLEHAGIDTQKATFLDHKSYRDHTASVLEWIAEKIKDKENVVGLQLLNEPHPDDHKRYNPWCRSSTSRLHTSLTVTFFPDESTLSRLRFILGDDFPFYIGGSISDQARMNWIRQQPGFIVMDYHLVSSRQPYTIRTRSPLNLICRVSSTRSSTIGIRRNLPRIRSACSAKSMCLYWTR